MKKLLVIAAAIALALCLFAIANAENPASSTSPARLLLNPQPLPPAPPPEIEKVLSIKLEKDQVKAIKIVPAGKECSTCGATITLTKSQLAEIGKMWPNFKGTTAKVSQAHVVAKSVYLMMKDGALVSTTKPKP